MSSFRSKLSLLLLILSFLTLSNDLISQQPFKVSAFYANAGPTPGNVSLVWLPNYASSSDQVKGFYLYKREIIQNQVVNTKLAKFEFDNSFVDSLSNASGYSYISTNNGNTWMRQGIFYTYSSYYMGDTLYGKIYHQSLSEWNVTYNLYMTAYGNIAESLESNLRSIIYNNQDSTGLVFKSIPVDNGSVNQLYEYTVAAETNKKADITYKLVISPTGMTINSSTGLIQWTPNVVGTYKVVVEAKATYVDGTTEILQQQFIITVKKCKALIQISGEVKDEKGNPVDYGIAYAYSEGGVNDSGAVFSARIKQGYYSFMMDAGNYKIFFPATNYNEGVWYENSQDKKNASIVSVDCGQPYKLNTVIMKSINTPQFFGVSGRVIDAITNKPIPYAYVNFQPIDGVNSKTYTVSTNISGYYQISLPDNYTFIASAQAVKDTLNNTVHWYIPQYYKLTNDLAQAERIKLTSSRNDINFALEPMPNYPNSMKGKVVDNDNILQPNSYVIAYLVEPIKNGNLNQMPVRTVYTDPYGEFEFVDLNPGKYVLLCVPPMRTYTAGYYLEKSTVVQSWQDATQITVSASSTIENINIKIVKKLSIPGPSGVSGVVLGNTTRILKKGESPLGANPINGAIVYLLNTNNEVIDYSFSNQTGIYQISDVAAGQYKISADRVGFTKLLYPIKLGNSVIDLPIELNSTSTTDVIEDEINSVIRIYPNPTNDLSVFTSTLSGEYSVKVSNILGEEIINYYGILDNFSTLDLSKNPTGIYLVSISNGINSFSKIIIKK
jgi:hypothetical protein